MKKALLLLLLAALVCAPVPTHAQYNSFPDQNKHHALLRLEDVGPGGAYATLDGLGKLRAVFQYLEAEHVPFQVATIPHWISLQQNGTWYNEGIDDPHPAPNVQAFIRLMQQTQQQGEVLGMHGYVHQYGTTRRADGNENTGTGFEFNVKGAPVTATTSYAADKITKSLHAFAVAGLTPQFWESPHYGDNVAQEQVFRSYMGLLFQPDFRSLRSLKDINTYDTENVYGSTTLGSVYIPAPLKYIQNQQSVTNLLNGLPNNQGLAAMYFHPFLEFPDLEPVTDATGHPVIQDGLPLYRYKAGTNSYLHQLVNGFKKQGYDWVTIFDVVPFSPAERLVLPSGTPKEDFLLGDVTGGQQADVVLPEQNRVEVIQGNFQWPRNTAQAPTKTWLQTAFGPDEHFLLADLNGDHRQDLLAWNKQTGALQGFLSTGTQFAPGTTLGTLPGGLDAVEPIDFNGDGKTDLLLRQGSQLYVALNQAGHFTSWKKVLDLPADCTVLTGHFSGGSDEDLAVVSADHKTVQFYSNQNGQGVAMADRLNLTATQQKAQLLVGDANGDGKSDLIFYDAPDGIWQVMQNHGGFAFSPIDNLFGPWAQGNRSAMALDLDGNGKADIAAYDPSQHVLDVALSFRK